MEKMIYLSTDDGWSYRRTRANEGAFKEKLWTTVCKWVRPDSEMVAEKYSSSVVIRRCDMSHIVTLEINGGDNLTDIWERICDAWEMTIRQVE